MSDGPSVAGPGQSPPPPSYSQSPPTNTFAVVSLVMGCAQWFFLPVGPILAIVFGHIARSQIRRSNGIQGGRGLATAGLVLGYAGLVLSVVALFLLLTAFSSA